MIKKVSIIALTLIMLFGSSGMALAAASENANGQGYLAEQGLDHEAILELKLERIESMYEDGRISKEQADQFKAAITERMENCEEDCTGEGRPEDAERLNIGFGFGNSASKGEGQGQYQGLGQRNANAPQSNQMNGTRGNGLHLAECI